MVVVAVSEEEERLVAEIPPELKRLVDADSRSIKDVVCAALWREYGGKRDGALERQITENEKRAAQAESERQARVEEIHGYARENHKLRQMKGRNEDRKREIAAQYLDKVGGLPNSPDNAAIQNWADKADMKPQTFYELLVEVRDDA